VYLPALRAGAATDFEGRFAVGHIPPGTYTINVRHLQYRLLNFNLRLVADIDTVIIIAPTEIQLPAMEIHGEHTPTGLLSESKSVAILAPEELEKLRGQTLGETLQQIPGVTALQTGPSISKPVIRGLHSDRVVVLNAGVPQEGQQWGGEHAPEIDPFSPARIEVIKGPSSVEYGSGAIGGVVRLEQRPLPHTPGLGGDLILNSFTNNRQGAGSLLLEGASSALPDVGFRLQGSFRKAGNEHAPDYVVGNTGFAEYTGSGSIGYSGENGSAEAYYSLFSTELGIYRGSHIGSLSDLQRAIAAGGPLTDYPFTYEIRPPKQNITHELWSLRGKYRLQSIGTFNVSFGRQSNHRQEYDAYRFFNDVQTLPTHAATDLTLTTYSLDLKLNHEPIGDFYGLVGVNGMRQGNVSQGSSFLIPNFRSYSGGAYAVEAWASSSVTITAGVRLDYRWLHVFPVESRDIEETMKDYLNVSGALGVTYEFHPEWTAAMNIGTAFRPPNISELFSNGVHHGTAEYERGDQNLQSERAHAFDLTVTHRTPTVRAELSVYSNWINNFIYLFPSAGPVLTLRGAFPAFQYKQNNARLVGFDGSLDVHVTGWYSTGVDASLVRGDNLDTAQPLIQMPADRLSLINTLTAQSLGPVTSPYIELRGTFVARQTRFQPHVDYLDPPPGYILLDLRVGGTISLASSPLTVRLEVRNLFNTSYRDYLSRFRYYIDDPGRDIILKVEIPFGNSEHSQ
jgi:iron complex outermembrane receptor protein